MNFALKSLILLIEGIFALGLIGSFCVLVLATIEDVKVLFHGNDHVPKSSPATSSGD